jgi:hypothetical protein
VNQPQDPEAKAPASPSGDEQVLFAGYPALIRSAGEVALTIFTLGVALVVLYFKRRGQHYRVTTQRIVIEHGLLSKRMEQLDIYRITDYTVDVPFGQRMMGTGNLILKSLDPTTPELHLMGLKTDIRALYENLRRATESERQRRGVRVLDTE